MRCVKGLAMCFSVCVCFSLWAGGSNQGGQLGEPLMRVAVCCSVLQCVAECCSVCVAVSWLGIRIKAVNSGCVAVCCSVLQCVAVCAKKNLQLKYDDVPLLKYTKLA